MAAVRCCMVLDTDIGNDDAIALMMALTQPSVDLIGITCVHGNTSLTNIQINALRVLKLFSRLDIPVYKGAPSSLIGSLKEWDGTYTHGNDGLGDVPDPDPPSLDLIQSEHAVTALIRMANERPGEITLVAIGPLTNLALAAKMDPEFSKKLKKLVIMGGNIKGSGNRPGSEFNFYMDPEAAHIVLHEYMCDITVVPLESCRNNGIPWDWYDRWTSTDTVNGRFVRDILRNRMEMAKEKHKHLAVIYDSLAMAVTINTSVVTKMTRSYVMVEVKGEVTKGQMVQIEPDMLHHCKDVREVDILLECDGKAYRDMLTQIAEWDISL